MLVTKLVFDKMMERNLWYWLVMMLNLAVSDMFEDMCGYVMMKRADRGSWQRLSYNTVVRRLLWPEGLILMSMKGTSVPECAQFNSKRVRINTMQIMIKQSLVSVQLKFQVWVIDA